MATPSRITLNEVGPREGFQFEGIGQPGKIATADKVRLIDMLATTGVRTIQTVSFVSPKQVPQMADAEAICAAITPRLGVAYTAIYLNDTGLERAIATKRIAVTGKLTLTASETFCLRNQRRTLIEDAAMQRKLAVLYTSHAIPITNASLMAAFGCNDEGPIDTARILTLIEDLHRIAIENDGTLDTLMLADTMGWANPDLVRRTVATVQSRWPGLRLGLHLHDTRGLAIANLHAGLQEGVDLFDTGVGGLGGCPFAGNRGAAGNVCTEEVVFLCQQIGVDTGVDLPAMIECARFAEHLAGHPLPSKLLNASLACGVPNQPAAV